jgi:hypothetical protein
MVQAMINIDEETNRLLNIVKAKYGLKDKSEAINLVTKEYGSTVLEPSLRPEYEKKLEKLKKGKFIKVDDFAKRYGMKK